MQGGRFPSKRERLLRNPKRVSLGKISRKTLPFFILGFFLVSAAWWIFKISSQDDVQLAYKESSMIVMSKVQATVENGRIEVPVGDVKERKLISFEYQSGRSKVPLLAYITPSGKFITAVSTCEPCNSTHFHIEGNEIVCDSCLTRWSLDTLKGVQGGCLGYPPDKLFHTQEGGKLSIKEIDVQKWKPRFVRG